MKYEWEAANRISQRLSHSSTRRNAGGLIFRVRDGYGSCPAAVAALMPTRGIEPRRGPTSVWPLCKCDPVSAWVRAVSVCGSSKQYEWWLDLLVLAD